MNLVSQYVLRVGAYMIFSLLLEGITPSGGSKKIVKLMIGLIFMYVLIQPVFDWISLKMPLSQLTTVEIEWDETERYKEVDYESQAWNMVGNGYEQVLREQGLPKELKEEYRLEEVKVEDVVEITLSRGGQIGGFEDRSLHLGQIGNSWKEEEQIINSLSDYWGIPAERLEMKLR